MLNDILFALVGFLSNIVQTVSGFAGTALAMPVSIRLVGYETASPVLNFIPIPVCLVLVILHFRKIRWKRLLFLLVFIGTGFGIGFALSGFLPQQEIVLKIYGGVICVIALIFLFLPNLKIPKFLHPVLLILAGVLHFLYTSGGPLVVLYASGAIEDRDEFRVTLSCVWLVLNSIRFTRDVVSGAFTPRIWILTLILTALTAAAIVIGRLIAKKLNREVFTKVTYALLFLSGLSAVL